MKQNQPIFLRVIFVIAFLYMSSSLAFSQKADGGVNMNEIKKAKKENQKAAKRAAEYGKKRHLSIQSIETRKRIKKNLKNAEKQHKKQNR